MELTAFLLSSARLVGVFLLGLLIRSYLPVYASEKAKNLASKEDISHLTHLVEAAKAEYSLAFEQHKAAIAAENQVIERRRKAYEDICSALRVFVAGHTKTDEAKERFHVAYASSWLWASEEVLAAPNRFIEVQVQDGAAPGSVSQTDLKAFYAAVLVGMRKDVGFPSTRVAASDYKFVQF